MNRTSKRIPECPFQPVRRDGGVFLSVNTAAERSAIPHGHILRWPRGNLIVSEDLVVFFYKAAAVAKLGLP
jgi:hypothetical protein